MRDPPRRPGASPRGFRTNTTTPDQHCATPPHRQNAQTRRKPPPAGSKRHSSMDQGQYYPGQPLPVAYGIPSGLPSAKSEEDRLREEVARLKSENAELRGEDDEELAPLGGGPPKKRGRPAKDDGQRPKKGGRPPKWALSEGQKPPAGGDDAPKGKGTHSRRPKKAEGAKKPRGAPTSEYHGVSGGSVEEEPVASARDEPRVPRRRRQVQVHRPLPHREGGGHGRRRLPLQDVPREVRRLPRQLPAQRRRHLRRLRRAGPAAGRPAALEAGAAPPKALGPPWPSRSLSRGDGVCSPRRRRRRVSSPGPPLRLLRC